MGALSAARTTKSRYNPSDRYRIVPIATGQTIFPGAIIALVSGEAKAAASGGGGYVAGWADLDTTLAEGATPATVNAFGTGYVKVCEGEAWFANGETIVLSDVGANGYAADDQTINTTAASLQYVGPIVDYDATRGVCVNIELAGNSRAVSHQEVGPTIQKGTATIATGTITVDTTIVVTDDSVILVGWDDAAADITFAATGGELSVVARTSGAVGIGAFTINTITGGGAKDATGAGVVRWAIIG